MLRARIANPRQRYALVANKKPINPAIVITKYILNW